MPHLARLFQNSDELVDAWRDALAHRNVQNALDLWLDDDNITCVLPEGQRLSGHTEIRKGLERLLATRALFLEPIYCISHATLGTAIYDTTEAVHFEPDQMEAEFFLNITLVILQDSQGWRIAHLHASRSTEENFPLPTKHHGLH
jgi:ketosteroid isomerase-like protein